VHRACHDGSTGSVRRVADPFCRGFWKIFDRMLTGRFSMKLWLLTVMMGDGFVNGKHTNFTHFDHFLRGYKFHSPLLTWEWQFLVVWITHEAILAYQAPPPNPILSIFFPIILLNKIYCEIPVIFPTVKKFKESVLYSQCNVKVPSIACLRVFQPNVTVNLVLTERYANRIYYRLFSSPNNDSYSLRRRRHRPAAHDN
jgi:hypothetical protein